MEGEHRLDLGECVLELVAVGIEGELAQGLELLVGRLVVPEREAGVAGHCGCLSRRNR